MATVGSGALKSFDSYLVVGRESTFKTYNTCTGVLDFISSSMKTMKEIKVIEQIEKSRTYSKKISLGKSVSGEIECYAYAESAGFNYLLGNALGGGIPSPATATGETAGGLAFTHTYLLGNFDVSYTSISLNHRKGDSVGAMVFQYNGVRVNEASFTAEIDEALKASFSLIAVDSTQTANDLNAIVVPNTNEPLSFVNGRVSVENTFASLTSSTFWHVQSVEFGVSNNLKSDEVARRIGSDVLDVLPPGIAEFNLSMEMRFDTTTAYDAMLAATQLSVELEFLGSTLTTSIIRRGIKFQFPKVFVSDAGDPEIGGADEVLTASIEFTVLRDDSSATGYACRALVTNLTASYA